MFQTDEIYIEGHECTVKIGKELGSKILIDECLRDYYECCTTRIIGLAAEECGRLGYDTENTFTKNELLDPDFGASFEDRFEDEYKSSPIEFLERLCSIDSLAIVDAIGSMEVCWKEMKPSPTRYQATCKILWDFSVEEAKHHVETLYGEPKAGEFETMGNRLFG